MNALRSFPGQKNNGSNRNKSGKALKDEVSRKRRPHLPHIVFTVHLLQLANSDRRGASVLLLKRSLGFGSPVKRRRYENARGTRITGGTETSYFSFRLSVVEISSRMEDGMEVNPLLS